MMRSQWSPELAEMTRAWFVEYASVRDLLVALKHVDGRFGVAGFRGPGGSQIVVRDRAEGTLQFYESVDALINAGWAID
ncbi:hypothetical protein AB3X91_33740 [Paraburkholderia sp. BR14263]|uniref:hypothetical protein n=1 Tax=unclassified Paraburkholderia TaxID=2615204 RepID=UPI0034CEC1DF